MPHFDVIIVGQGLAGTTLAWTLRHRGLRAAIVDRGGENASRAAAGLITPVTGQRMAASWRYAEFFQFAREFYREVEAELGISFFHRRGTIRLFLDPQERIAFERRESSLLRGLVNRPPELVDAADFRQEHGGFEMPDAARLDVPTYLSASRDHFEREGLFHIGEVNPETDIASDNVGIVLRRQGLTGSRLIFCQGFEANSLFPTIPFNAVKGEVLTLRIPGLSERRVIHRGIWLAPLEGDRFLAGSTYEREQLDAIPTDAGRSEIERRLREFLNRPFDVMQHRAGVRPVLQDGRPILELHPTQPQVGVFNGLGSKGALIAPYFAEQLAKSLLEQTAIDREVSLRRTLPQE